MKDKINPLWKNIPEHVSELFAQYGNSSLVYHNLEHTKLVVKRAMEIAAAYPLDGRECFIIFAAASFHDTGQLFTAPEHHERKSAEIMKNYLNIQNIDQEIIQEIEHCIMATKIPHRPTSELQQIICDADTYNLGTEEFLLTDNQLKEELSLRGFVINDDWDKCTLDFLSHHCFFTNYCKQKLNQGKQQNIQTIIERINKK